MASVTPSLTSSMDSLMRSTKHIPFLCRLCSGPMTAKLRCTRCTRWKGWDRTGRLYAHRQVSLASEAQPAIKVQINATYKKQFQDTKREEPIKPNLNRADLATKYVRENIQDNHRA